MDLKGQTALVTGGSRGLGRAAAEMLALAGADVAISYRSNRDVADDVATRCAEHGVRAFAFKAEMSNPGEVSSLMRRTLRQFGRLDILVCNAGIWKEAAIEAMTEERLAEMMDINVRGVFRCCREAVPVMKKQGSGRIILVSSTAGQRGEALHSHYAASKGAVISLTKSLAAELAPDGILVNCIAPGWFDTDMTTPTMADPTLRRQVLATIPLGRIGRPDEFAGAVLFLASDLSTFVTGEILNVNGGAVLAG
ncbi:MAG: 3-oxoacyl-ACP reductase FabG [candidate division WOR-3 bacterium]|nr:MAG: 3-oxoacyl-ACP reductase FabG [candidate division WOR-3 bacterium]